MTVSQTRDGRPISVPGKPVEIEGILDLYLIRPIGAVLAGWFRHTPISPNTVSWLSVVAAFGAAVAYYQPTLSGAAIGSLFLLASSGLDSADGQLARATGRTSELGETLDGFCDSLSFGMIYVAAALHLVTHMGLSLIVVFPVALVSGLSHSLQSALVDYERQLFVYFTRGSGRVERESPARLRAEFLKASAEGRSRLALLLRWLRLRYCEIQQSLLRPSTDLLELFAQTHGDVPSRVWFADRYRNATRSMLHAWTLMAPNCHKVAIAVCAFLAPLAPGWPAAQYGLGLVLAFNLVLNLALVLLIVAQRRVDRNLVRELAAFAAART